MRKHQNISLFIINLFIAVLLYLPTLTATWQFDDLEHVLRRNQVGQDSFTQLLTSTLQVATDPKGTRSLVNATFLLNWKLSPHPLGFHIVNVFIHASASFVVFLLIKEILERLNNGTPPRHPERPKEVEGSLSTEVVEKDSSTLPTKSGFGRNDNSKKAIFTWSVVGSLLFLVHPIQSQAVAYITQRYESLMTLFYLTALYLFFRKRYLLSFIAGFLATSAKEVAITLPMALVASDYYFNHRASLNLGKRFLVHGIFFLLVVKVILQLFSDFRTPGIMAQEGSFLTKVSANTQVLERNRGLTRTTYALTELNVIPFYIRLLFIPLGQSLDHDFKVTTSVWQWPTPFSTLFLLSLLGIMIMALIKKEKLLSFAIFFFFLTLSISSSIFPIDDVVNEHRLYLPMFGLVLFVVWVGGKIRNIKFIKFITVIMVIFGLLTFHRSLVWSTPLSLWGDAWKKAPNKARTNKNYGFLLTEAGRIPEGIEKLTKAVELYDVSDYRRNLGLAYLKAGDYPRAEEQFRLAIARDPADPKPPSDLGVALAQQGKYAEAVASFQEALKLDPSLYEALIGVGGVSILTGDYQAAQVYLNRAREKEPLDPRSYNNLYVLYVRQKDAIKARAILDLLSQIDSNYPGLKERYLEVGKLQKTK